MTQAHLAQIERVNPVLNALVEAADPEECLRQADHADECAARGEPLGAAHGLPVVVKDVMKVAGLACSGGSRTLRAVAHTDATAVARLRGAGAIVLGPGCQRGVVADRDHWRRRGTGNHRWIDQRRRFQVFVLRTHFGVSLEFLNPYNWRCHLPAA